MDAVAGSSVDEVGLLRLELARAHRRIGELEADKLALSTDNERLSVEIDRLRARLEESRRAGKRQAAPFSRGGERDEGGSQAAGS